MLKTYWKRVLKISACVENHKKACWKFQHVLKSVMHVEKVCWKFQCMFKTVMHVEKKFFFTICYKVQMCISAPNATYDVTQRVGTYFIQNDWSP